MIYIPKEQVYPFIIFKGLWVLLTAFTGLYPLLITVVPVFILVFYTMVLICKIILSRYCYCA